MRRGIALLALLLVTVQAMAFTLSGRIEIDTAHYQADRSTMTSGHEVRRARLGLSLPLSDRWHLYSQTDLRNERLNPQANWVRFRVSDDWSIKLGRQNVPFSLENLSSSRHNLFMERALPNVLGERYATGAGISAHRGDWHATFALFGDDHIGLGGRSDYGRSAATRLIHNWGQGRKLLHIGAAYQWHRPDRAVRFRARPETHVSGQRLIDTGEIYGARHLARADIELVWQNAEWFAQGEVLAARVERGALPDALFSGAYVEVGRTFGGQRRFSRATGKWGGFSQLSAFRTWEIGLRASQLELNGGGIQGGKEHNITLGLNWYLNDNSRVMFNITKAWARPNRRGQYESPTILQARLQLGF